jgi:ankyrin repeat protein
MPDTVTLEQLLRLIDADPLKVRGIPYLDKWRHCKHDASMMQARTFHSPLQTPTGQLNGEGNSTLHLLASIPSPPGASEIVASLIRGRVDPNLQNCAGDSALHIAARSGSNEVIWMYCSFDITTSCSRDNHNTYYFRCAKR